MQWWVHQAYENGGIVLLFSWVFWVIGSITLHELSHGWAALANGDRTPRELGHMTLNPVVHMGWMSLVFFAITGLAWGLMPTDPRRYRHERRGRVLVAAAGPAMNLAIAVVALTAIPVWSLLVAKGTIAAAPHTFINVLRFLEIGGFLNLVLAAFNLLPVPPLDGSAILAGASRRLDRFYSQPAVQMYGMVVMLLLFFGVVDVPLQHTMSRAAGTYVRWVSDRLGVAEAEPARERELEDANNDRGAAGPTAD